MTTEASLAGNDTLVRTKIKNYDVRFEYYPAPGQVVSVTGFYKDFKDPIEQVVYFSGNKTYSYQNVNGAKNYGVEFEFRFRPSVFLENKEKSILNSFTLFSNVALIKSEVDLGNVTAGNDSVRALQGQSPYVVNAGIQFMEEKTGVGITGVFNQIGDRITHVGGDNYFNIIESHRPLFDLQFSKRFFKKAEIKFTINDVFNKKTIFYWDVNNNNKYDELTDRYIDKNITGTGYSVSFSYKF
jgi:outer membrane receptor protein involved in Fe transport